MASKISKIGLTGGIGTGKSQVRKRFAELGTPTIDADALAKHIAASDKRAVTAIRNRFGGEIYAANGTLQRQILAKKVFGDASALADLNAILHPLVFEYVDRQVAQLAQKGERFVIIEAALFYESGWHRQMDYMIVVTAPPAKRLAWLKARDNAAEADIRARMAHQLPEADKAAQADYLIENQGTLADLMHAVDRLCDSLKKATQDSD